MKLGLRVRGTIAFALLAFGVSVGLATLTYQAARAFLTDQRHSLVVRQAGLNARALNARLRTPDASVSQFVTGLPNTYGSHALAHVGGKWYSSSVPTDDGSVPPDVLEATSHGRAVQRTIDLNGTPTMVVGIPLTSVRGEYFEIAPLNELQRTLAVLGWSLTAAAAVTGVLGALLGMYASRRVLRPLREFSQAAEAVGRGEFGTRLSVEDDPDLAPYGRAFNEMAEALEIRTDRDAYFASNVSHELRTPLTALSAAVDVLDARANGETRPAVDVVRGQVAHFQRLLLDLLELSRLDSGHPELVLETVEPRRWLQKTVADITGNGVPVDVDATVPERINVDRRRIERVLTNLLDNAERHGGGALRVAMGYDAEASAAYVAVEDRGPGVPEAERTKIFERFHRAVRTTDDERGSGLGLAIVAEQCRAHGGSARFEVRRGGGSRFIAHFRAERPR